MLYKLTDKNGMTQGNTQWGESVTHEAKGEGTELCTGQVIHAYRDPYLAVFYDPIGGNYGENALLWESEGRVVADDKLKVGCKSLTTLRQIPLPVLTTEQRVEIAIRISLLVYKEKSYVIWADNWLSGKDRTEAAEAAKVAAEAAYEAAGAAYEAAEAAEATEAAYEAAGAAYEAAEAAYEAAARAAGWAAARAAEARVSTESIIKIIYDVVGRE